MNVTIIGLGLIGGSIAKDLKRTGFATEIVGVDSNPEHGKKAVELGIADRYEELETAVQQTDLVVIAIPVDKIKIVLPKVLDLIPENTTVTDVGSTKREIVSLIEKHPKRGNYVPSHPMSGTENSGPVAAIENLFEDKICIICDQEKSRPQHVALIEKMYQSIGMSTAYMSSDEQDHNTAFVSHLPHVTAFALANAVLAKEDRSIIFDLASGGFRSTVRLAKSSPEMWGPIFHQNRDYMVEAIGEYQKHLEAFKKSIQNEDAGEMMELIKHANGIRSVLDGGNQSMTKKEKTIIQLFTPKN
ncbi:prephenate dehydrogenase [Prolixibacter denitrificans]|uniref:Prephenate dehydrogenase n=1 Tax=Prolixibacter denitrificans TaxID=1541063 RepID=A0A2P8CH97_9BACT|nr:prephenate dehydrogenase [Prolixibacter denitrificans]PSK84355.1 prephenate dehydrogenase [Prolixibacter denitrificans]GET20530.1 prephenate dehydrogenase [Prolixibacter denitrificans]